MRITGITSRIISYDVSAIYGEVGPPQEISADYRYSFDTLHTDEGIDGRSMQFGWMGEGQAIGHALHQGTPVPHRPRPAGARASLAGPAPPEPPRLQPDRRSPGRHRHRALGHPRQGRRPAHRAAARSRTRPHPHLRDGDHRQPDARNRSTRRRSSGSDRAIAASRSSSGTAWTATFRASAPRARPSGPTSPVPGRRRVLLVDRSARRRLCAGRAELPLVRGAASRPPGLPAQAPGRRDPHARAHRPRRAAPRDARGAFASAPADLVRGDVLIKSGITGLRKAAARRRAVRLQPRDPWPGCAAARRREPPCGALDRELRVLRGPRGALPRRARRDAAGDRRRRPPPPARRAWSRRRDGLDWVDDHTVEVIRSGEGGAA